MKVRNGIIRYHFLLSPRNTLQMFKPIQKFLYTEHQPLLIFLRQKQTDVFVKDSEEPRDYVAWTVVIV